MRWDGPVKRVRFRFGKRWAEPTTPAIRKDEWYSDFPTDVSVDQRQIRIHAIDHLPTVFWCNPETLTPMDDLDEETAAYLAEMVLRS